MRHYRAIWEEHFGEIPKDIEGRTYEIHHINGNNTDNRIENLKCLSLQEHYNIHFQQKDYAACLRMTSRMKVSVEEKCRLASESNKKRLQEKNHPFIDPENRKKILERTQEKVKAGTHIFQNMPLESRLRAIKNYTINNDRSECVKKGWLEYKNRTSKEEVLNRTIKGSKSGAMKTKGTKWYHKLDGSHLRTIPSDPRVKNENWVEGRFNGSELMKVASKKYSHKGRKKSEEVKLKTKETNFNKTLLRFTRENIKESIEKSKNANQAVYYFNTNFGPVSYPTFVKMRNFYNL